MRTLYLAAAVASALTVAAAAADKDKGDTMTGPLQFKMKGIDGKEVDLAKFKGKVVLFVNVASRCGYTKQYKGMQTLFDKFEKDGLVVIGVPANEFGMQESGTDAEIKEFCATNYQVTFPMMSKVVVKGDGISPLYKHLTGADTDPKFAGEIGWNFEKFLVGRDGQVVARYKSNVDPMSEDVTKAVAAELAKK